MKLRQIVDCMSALSDYHFMGRLFILPLATESHPLERSNKHELVNLVKHKTLKSREITHDTGDIVRNINMK